MTIRPIRDPAEGERVLAVEPPIAPMVDAGWRRRLHLFTGRALSDVALAAEQEGRAGRLAAAGRAVSHGVVSGLEVGIERVDEPVPPADRRNPDAWPYWTAESAPTPEPATVPRWYVHVAPGQGIAASGEDVKVPRALRIPLDLLWVYLTPPSGSSSSGEGVRVGVSPDVRLPPELRGIAKPGLLSSVLAARSVAEAPTAAGATLRTAVSLPRLPGLSVHAATPLRAPTVAAPDFRGPLWTLRRDGAPLPRAGVLVLQPISMEVVGQADPTDPCEYDPQADAYADWQRVDGCRLVLYAWPYSWLPDPAGLTARNQIADQVFRWEAAQLPGERHPWEGKGVPLGLVGMDAGNAPLWVDSGAVVRAGGKPRRRSALVAGVGSPFLWQARLQQFAEQAAETDWTAADAGAILRRFRWLPPAGLLPRAAADEGGRPRHVFPDHWTVDAVPVPLEHLDAAIEASAPLAPFDLASGHPDRLRVLVPVPEAWYEPRLLVNEQVGPEFQEAVDTFVARRTEMLRRREDLGEKAAALVEAYTGTRPERSADRERQDDEDLAEAPVPISGLQAHESPAAEGWHGHGFEIVGEGYDQLLPLLFSVDLGETVFTYVYLDPAAPPSRIEISWIVRPGTFSVPLHTYWAPQPDPVSTPRTWWMGPLPPTGRWVRLSVPAHRLSLERSHLSGMRFSLHGGRALWDRSGKIRSSDRVWWNNATPRGAVLDPPEWDWRESDPYPFTPWVSDVLSVEAGKLGQHSFSQAQNTLPVGFGETLFVYVRPDGSAPRQIMLEWNDGSWEHRAYWGENLIPRGRDGTASRRYMGPLPHMTGWTRLEVPAALVGLEGRTLSGMSLVVQAGGQATRVAWDRAGVKRRLVREPGTGLLAEYFSDDGMQLPLESRVAPTVEYGAEWPGQSARWTGQWVPESSEVHTIRMATHSTARLFVDGEKVLELVGAGAAREATFNLEAEAGRRYDLKVEFEAKGGGKFFAVLLSNPDERLVRIPTRTLYPSATAGALEPGLPAEVVWFDESLPPAAIPDPGGEGWNWVAAAPLEPPEESYRTERRGSTRVALPLEQLRRELAVTPLHPAETRRLDQVGLERFVAHLDALVRRADDWVDFGFLRVQSDMYRLRQLMLGTTAATRLATSPALARIITQESAVGVREGILGFLKEVKLAPGGEEATAAASGGGSTPVDKSSMFVSTTFISPFLAMSAVPQETTLAKTAAAPAEPTSPTAKPVASLSLASAQPTLSASLARIDLEPDFLREPVFDLDLGTIGEPVQPVASPTLDVSRLIQFTPTPLPRVTLPGGGVDTGTIIGKAPIIGEPYDFRTVTVGERMETPAANEAHSYAKATRFEVLDGLNALGLALDDLLLPGFVRTDAEGDPVYRSVKTTGAVQKQLQVPVRTARRFGDVRRSLAALVLGEADPPDADETIFFNVAVELLDATTAGLRVVEGRVQQYRDALDRCRKTLTELHALAVQIDRRIKTVEDELSEARHDVAVSRALLAEETDRVDAINERRATILREHVHFLAFHRPRLAHADAEVPVRALNPAYTPASVPACLADTTGAPPELRGLVEMLREAPVRWFPAVRPLVDALDRPDVLLGTVTWARDRARGRQEPAVLESVEGRRGGKLGMAIQKRMEAQRTVVGEWRRTLAAVDLGRFRGQGWQWMRDRAVQVLSLGDLIDASHGRSKVDRGATRELDDVLRVAACLHRRFGEVLPSLRLEWAERLSQHDEPVELRSLYSLPRWGEVPYVDGREMQAQVDWLYGRVDPREPQATALVSDLVRVCLLLASHAPVDQIVAGTVERQTEVKAGGTVPLVVDLGRVRIGMPVLLYDERKRPVKGVVEDVAGGVAVTRILQTPERATVTLPQGARVQLGESVDVSVKPRAQDRGTEREAARERTLEKLEQRRRRYDTARQGMRK